MNKEKTIDEYIKDVWGNDIKKFIINSYAEAYIHRLERENQQLKKQQDDVVEYCNKTIESLNWKKRDIMQILTPENGYLKTDIEIEIRKYKDLLRMLGEK